MSLHLSVMGSGGGGENKEPPPGRRLHRGATLSRPYRPVASRDDVSFDQTLHSLSNDFPSICRVFGLNRSARGLTGIPRRPITVPRIVDGSPIAAPFLWP